MSNQYYYNKPNYTLNTRKFNFNDPDSLQRAYGILARLQSPEKSLSWYGGSSICTIGNTTQEICNNNNNCNNNNTAAAAAACPNGICNMRNSECTSRGNTTPF